MKNYFEVKTQEDIDKSASWFCDKLVNIKEFKPFVVTLTNIDKWKTQQQNKAFHALLDLFYKSGCHSYNVKKLDELKNCYKRQVGLTKYFLYYDGEKINKVESPRDIPRMINKNNCWLVLDSWSNASVKQAKNAIELLITDMLNSEISQTSYGKEFDKIMNQLER